MRLFSLLLITSISVLAYAALSGTLAIHYVATGSMEPSIPVGSLVVAVKDAYFAQGDIVVYSMGDAKLMHRVAEVRREGLLVTADAQPRYWEIVDWERVHGKVVAALPILGYLYLGAAAIPLAVLALSILLLLIPTDGGVPSLFWVSALSVIAMSAIGDTGLTTLGRPLAALMASAVAVSCRILETRAEEKTRLTPQLCYVLLAAACLTSISRQAILRGVGL
ncbi:MAG: S26 family signal peptidase [Nitrososphaerota archaeon]